jgi:imidazolonepropionase-like amidohydrolase
MNELERWANFYLLMSAAAATLLGLMFVIITLAAERRLGDTTKIPLYLEVTDKFHKLPPAMHATDREEYQHQLVLTKLFDDAGVRMMVGTDGGGQAPGQSIHQEFDELAKAGLSPFKILQMTTLYPAEFLGRTATMGSIEVGKNADIVLLDGNPVESVQNLHSIAGVVRAGFYYSHHDLDALRERAKEPPKARER